jgi:hypothetical protein
VGVHVPEPKARAARTTRTSAIIGRRVSGHINQPRVPRSSRRVASCSLGPRVQARRASFGNGIAFVGRARLAAMPHVSEGDTPAVATAVESRRRPPQAASYDVAAERTRPSHAGDQGPQPLERPDSRTGARRPLTGRARVLPPPRRAGHKERFSRAIGRWHDRFVLEVQGITADESALALLAARGPATDRLRETGAQTVRRLARSYDLGGVVDALREPAVSDGTSRPPGKPLHSSSRFPGH